MTSQSIPARPQLRVLTASAARLNLDDSKAAKHDAGRRQAWQDEAWTYFDEVPEIKFATLWAANLMQKVVFFAGYQLDDGSIVPINSEKSPVKDTTLAANAVFEMSRLAAPVGGQGMINWLGTLNTEVCGEFFIHGQQELPAVGVPGDTGYRPARPETWTVRSVSQIVASKEQDSLGRDVFLLKESPEDKGTPIDNDTESIIRVWQPHPRWTNLADCHLRSCLSDCETLVLMQNQQKAESKSRQAPGILLIPSELSFDVDPDPANDEAGDPADNPQANPFVKSLTDALLQPVEDPSSAGAVVPLVISAPAEFLKPDVFRVLSFNRVADETLDKRIDSKINRLARGLNVPVEVVMGHMSTTFSNAEQIDEDKFKDHLEPRCMQLADSYQFAFLRPNLAALNHDVVDLERVRVWFEPGAIVRSASAEENAEALWDAGAISYAAYRRLKGASEEDAPSEEEFLVQLAARKGIFTADLTTIVMKKGGVDLGATVNAEASQAVIVEDGSAPAGESPVDSEDTTDEEPPPEEPEPVTASASTKELRLLGRRLADVDRRLRAQLQGAAEAAMARALERAGNRVKARRGTELAASARPLPPYRVCADLGEAALTAAGFGADDLLDGAWDELGNQFRLWAQQAGQEALDLVSRALSGFTQAEREALRLRQLQHIDDAWSWLDNALGRTGKDVLFNPERGALGALDAIGEWAADVRVPPGLIREALALAGGQSGMMGAPGILTPTNNAPVGGIATGELVLTAMRDEGAYAYGYVWVYGPGRRRTFEPHAQLDGVEFQNFDDPALSNFYGWPETPHFYPGDHSGCLCDFEPLFGPLPSQIGEAPVDEGAAVEPSVRGEFQDRAFTGRKIEPNAEGILTPTEYGGNIRLANAKHGDLVDVTDRVYEEKLAMMLYGQGNYEPINDGLRGLRELDAQSQQTIVDIDKVMARDSTKQDLLVFRGVDGDWTKQLVPGAEFIDPAYTSTTLVEPFARGWVQRTEQGMVMEIRVPKGSAASTIEATKFGQEAELVLARGSKFRILERDGNRLVAELLGAQR